MSGPPIGRTRAVVGDEPDAVDADPGRDEVEAVGYRLDRTEHVVSLGDERAPRGRRHVGATQIDRHDPRRGASSDVTPIRVNSSRNVKYSFCTSTPEISVRH